MRAILLPLATVLPLALAMPALPAELRSAASGASVPPSALPPSWRSPVHAEPYRPGPARSLPTPGQPGHAGAYVTMSGRVLDPSGSPLPDVFVQQRGGIASTTTDRDGRFQLRTDPRGAGVLLFTAVGYLSATLPVGQAGVVTLRPIPTYAPAFAPVVPEPVATADTRFDTSVAVQWRARQFGLTSRGASVTSWADDEVWAEGRYNTGFGPVLGLSGWREKTPFTPAGLTPAPSPLPSVETSSWQLSAGWDLGWPVLELLPQLVYSTAYVANSSGVPYTGTPLDWNQTRQGLGVALDLGTRIGLLEVLAHGSYVPWTNTASTAPYPVGPLTWGDAALTVGLNVFPGLRLDCTYDRPFANGANLAEGDNVVGVGLSYHPVRIAP